MQQERIINSEQEMIELGRELVEAGYHKFGLVGELGAGKTHFTKGVAQGLGLSMTEVHSPTYVYFHEYTHPVDPSKSLLHVDMYRMIDYAQMVKIGLEEKLQDYQCRCIERPRFEYIDKTEFVSIIIDILDNQNRRVTISFDC